MCPTFYCVLRQNITYEVFYKFFKNVVKHTKRLIPSKITLKTFFIFKILPIKRQLFPLILKWCSLWSPINIRSTSANSSLTFHIFTLIYLTFYVYSFLTKCYNVAMRKSTNPFWWLIKYKSIFKHINNTLFKSSVKWLATFFLNQCIFLSSK